MAESANDQSRATHDVGPPQRPVVFVIHATEDRERVAKMKVAMDQKFSRSIEFFVSSDAQSIPGGTDWFEWVKARLQCAKVVLLFVTRRFVERPWCFFEAGGAMLRDLTVIPIWCHDALPQDAPFIFHRLQGYRLTDVGELDALLHRIAAECSARVTTSVRDCEMLQRFLGVGEPPSADPVVERGFEEYCRRLLDSDEIIDRICGIRMMSGLRTSSSLLAMVRATADENRHVREVVVKTLEGLHAMYGVGLVQLLLNEIPHQSHEVIRDSARLIQRVGSARDIGLIKEFLAGPGLDTCMVEALQDAVEVLVKRFA